MIHLTGIERTFLVGDEAVHALSSVNFTVHQGEYVAIMGPSGSGKSTLLNIIGLLDRPDKGIYTLENLDTTELTDDQQASVRRNKIGFVFQFFHLVPRLTAAENVELPMILADVDTAFQKISRPGGPFFSRPQRPRQTSSVPVVRGTAPTRCHCQGHHYAAGCYSGG